MYYVEVIYLFQDSSDVHTNEQEKLTEVKFINDSTYFNLSHRELAETF